MRREASSRRWMAVAVVLVTIAAGAGPAGAAEPGPGHQTSAVPAAVRAAMERDLGLRGAQLDRVLASAERAQELDSRLRVRLAGGYGGSWFDQASGSLRVAVTGRAAAELARAAGAVPVLVRHPARKLTAITRALDARAVPGLVSWGVDVPTNQVVVTVRAGQADEAAALVTEFGDAVRVEESVHQPQALQERLDGGTPYNGCTTGFNLTGADGTPYVLTAGHCGAAGTVAAANGVVIGPVVESVYPNQDHALIRVTNTSAWVTSPFVRTWPGTVRQTGYANLLPGWTVCKSGRTTGWTCGLITRTNETVVLLGGFTVHGLTRHTACSEPGDSGGPNLTVFHTLGAAAALGTSTAAVLVNGQCPAKSGQPNDAWYFPTSTSIPYYDARYGVSLVR